MPLSAPYYADAIKRDAFYAGAWLWLGTPFRPNTMLAGVGVDCARLQLAIHAHAGAVHDPATLDLPRSRMDHHWHNGRGIIERIMQTIPLQQGLTLQALDADAPAMPGDILLLKWGRTHHHMAGVYDADHIIHIAQGSHASLYHISDQQIAKLERKAYRIYYV